MRTHARLLTRLAAASWLVGLAMAASSCGDVSKGELARQVSTRASPGSFRAAGVSTVIERRCGSLDCHGSLARNMRIYSSRGLRLPNEAGVRPGEGDTTIDEITANYHSAMTIEPEATNAVVAGGDPNQLLLIKKPLGIEKHKGGTVFRRGDDTERCLVTWLTEDLITPVDSAACARAAIFPKE